LRPRFAGPTRTVAGTRLRRFRKGSVANTRPARTERHWSIRIRLELSAKTQIVSYFSRLESDDRLS